MSQQRSVAATSLREPQLLAQVHRRIEAKPDVYILDGGDGKKSAAAAKKAASVRINCSINVF